MKTELLINHPVEDIKNIWITYMQERSRLADVLTVILKLIILFKMLYIS